MFRCFLLYFKFCYLLINLWKNAVSLLEYDSGYVVGLVIEQVEDSD